MYLDYLVQSKYTKVLGDNTYLCYLNFKYMAAINCFMKITKLCFFNSGEIRL